MEKESILEKQMIKIEDKIELTNCGLYTGKMGLAICTLKVHRQTGNTLYRKKAQRLLNDISIHIADVGHYGFSTGLLGIGWGISWIAKNGYLKIDTEEVLSDLDDEIYKLVMYDKASDISLENGLLGRLLYIYKRITANKTNQDYYRNTCLTESLILCLDELEENLYKIINKSDLLFSDWNILAQSLLMLGKLRNLNLAHSVNSMITAVLNKCEQIFSFNDGLLVQSKPNPLMVAAYRMALEQNNKTLQRNVERYFNMTPQMLKLYLGKTFIGPKHKYSEVFHALKKISVISNDYSWQEGWLLV